MVAFLFLVWQCLICRVLVKSTTRVRFKADNLKSIICRWCLKLGLEVWVRFPGALPVQPQPLLVSPALQFRSGGVRLLWGMLGACLIPPQMAAKRRPMVGTLRAVGSLDKPPPSSPLVALRCPLGSAAEPPKLCSTCLTSPLV